MKTTSSRLPGVLLLEPKVFWDERGFFLESYNEKVMACTQSARECAPQL